ncbi:MAG: hypothetical protein WBM00_09050 [Solirubrobacterales bacterium]
MRSNKVRLALGVAVVVIAVVLLIVLRSGGDGESTDAGAVATIAIKHGKPVGGVRDLTYNKGDRIRFRVVSDTSDEIHVHGYDVMKDVKAGGSVSFDFPATLEGVFEAELEGRKEQIIQLTVNP